MTEYGAEDVSISHQFISMMVNQVEKIDNVKGKISALLRILDSSRNKILTGIGAETDWKSMYQIISEIELTCNKIIEILTTVSSSPIGIDDSFNVLRSKTSRAKEKLMLSKRNLPEDDIKNIDLNLRNVYARVRSFSESMEYLEKRELKERFVAATESRQLRREVIELKVENEKLRRRIRELESALNMRPPSPHSPPAASK